MNSHSSEMPAPRSSPSIRVQSVVYRLASEAMERTLTYLDNAARIAMKNGIVREVMVAYGDCSPEPTIDEAMLRTWQDRFKHLRTIEYTFFDANLGSAAGHNRLLDGADSDLVMILNPDVLASPTLFIELDQALNRPGVGLVEARQIPIEHPKDFDPETGETSWASTACAMGSLQVFREVNGFDADSFFLYGDDVDFSWRVRLAGYKVVHQSSAFVFHDKRLSHEGHWISSPAERYYSAEATLLLTYKWSRSDLTESYLRIFNSRDDSVQNEVAAAFEKRREAGKLPVRLDPDHKIGQFVEGAYAQHRFPAR
jgi:hypothetical protein